MEKHDYDVGDNIFSLIEMDDLKVSELALIKINETWCCSFKRKYANVYE